MLYVDGIFLHNGEYLLFKRNVEPFKGFWHVVGGQIEENETPQQALIREFKEETNLRIKVGDVLTWRTEVTSDRIKLVAAFKVLTVNGTVRLNNENEAYGWFHEFPSNCVYDYSKHI